MNLDEAKEIVALWGQHLEFRGDVLQRLFIANIPMALLPASAEKIEQALNVAAESYHDAGDYEAARTLTSTFSHLVLYGDDDDSLEGAAIKFGDATTRKRIIAELLAFRS